MTYHAFISYSHSADARLAPLLQRALERLGTPWWRRAALRVFRDDDSLPASAALWSGIEAALARSQHLVLLASPGSAASPWIDREVRWWLAHRDPDKLLIAVTAGELVYDRGQADFDFPRSSCLPAALKGVFKREPHWVDLRPARHAEHLSLRDTRLRSPALALAAAVRGVSKDALENADMRQHRRAWTAVLGAVAVLLGAGAVTLLAMNTARTESEAARLARLQAESRRLAAEARAQMERGGVGGMAVEAATLKAALAWRLAPTQEARQALRLIADETPGVVRVLRQHTSQIVKLLFSADAQTLYSADTDGHVLGWRLADGSASGLPMSVGKTWPQQLLRSRDGGHVLITGNPDSETGMPFVGLFAVPQGVSIDLGTGWRQAFVALRKGIWLDCAAVSPSGQRVALAFYDALVVVDTSDGRSSTHKLPGQARISALGFASDDRLMLLTERRNGAGFGVAAVTLTLPGGQWRQGPARALRANRCAYSAFSPDGQRVAVREGTDSIMRFWSVSDALALTPLAGSVSVTDIMQMNDAPAFDSAGHRVAWGDRGTARTWDFTSGRALRFRSKADSHGPQVVLSDDGRLAAAVLDSVPVLWTLDDGGSTRRVIEPRCGSGSLEDACIQLLCERLTAKPDAARWRELLGDAYPLIERSMPGTDCAATGPSTGLPKR